MQNFLKFAFGFLYTRNWHTGQKELSQSRLFIFGGIAFVLVVSLVVISFLQAPLEVVAI